MMSRTMLVAMACCVAFAAACVPTDVRGPTDAVEADTTAAGIEVLWSPERVGEGRRFRVIVRCASPVECAYPDAVELLDCTPSDSSRTEHRFYFVAGSPSDSASIVFSSDSAANSPQSITFPVIAERDWDRDATVGEIQIPRVWPLDRREIGLKQRHTLFPREQIGQNPREDRPDVLTWSDEELWGLVLPCDVPRWHFMNLKRGCPVHGRQVYSENAYYPWIVDSRTDPYRIQCPVGGERYPSNDYASGDYTTGDYPDDGFGFEQDSVRFPMAAYGLLRRVRYTYNVVSTLSAYFRDTGDPHAAHQLALLLASIAREQRYLSYFPEHRFGPFIESIAGALYRKDKSANSLGPLETVEPEDLVRSGMDDYSINTPKLYGRLCDAYDLVFDRIDEDEGLVEFVSQQMPWLTDGPAVRGMIETYILRAGVQGSLDRATDSNLPRPQEALLQIIQTLDQPECSELTEWLVHGGGEVASMPVNFYYKDGAAFESVGGYNGIHVSEFVPLATGLRALCVESPGVYSPERFDVLAGSERMHSILRWPTEVVVAQTEVPFIGDHGGIPRSEILDPMPIMDTGRDQANLRVAIEWYPEDSLFSSALSMHENVRERRQFRRQHPDSAFAPLPSDPDLLQPSRLSDGYGVGILESGSVDNRRGVWLYYGDHPHHAHDQRMDMGLIAHRRNLLRHMGYPYSWEHAGNWDANWLTHYKVRIAVPDSVVRPRSTVRLFHGGGPFQIVEALGYGMSLKRVGPTFLEAPDVRMRRALCLVDLPDGRFYAVDLLRAEGGVAHWWSFHGPPGEMTTNCDASLTAQETGTAAGPDVEYGADTPHLPDGTLRSLSNLYDVRRGNPSAPVSAAWALDGPDSVNVRMTQVAPAGVETIFARGRSPHAPADDPPYELDWVLRHVEKDSQETALRSDFITVIEADGSLPLGRVESISADGVTGVRVEADSVIHWVLRADGVTPDSRLDTVVTVGDIEFSGRAGFIETDRASGGLRKLVLLGGGKLTWRGEGILAGAPNWKAAITGVEPDDHTITVHAEPPPPRDLVGRYLIVSRAFGPKPDGDCFAYRVEAITRRGPDTWDLSLNWPIVTAEGVVARHAELGFTMSGELPLGRARPVYRGSYLLNADRSVSRRLADAGRREDDETYVVPYPVADSSFATSYPVGSTFTIEEIGVGDTAVVAGYTELTRSAGRWDLRTSAPAETNVTEPVVSE